MSVDVSPDGKTLVFDILGDLYTVPMTGGAAVRITSGPAYDFQPRFSPDGKRILFTSDRGGSDNLWTVAPDGSGPLPITADTQHVINSGAWSPDGEYVVARKRLTDQSSIGTVELWLYHRLGGAGIQVTKKSELPDANGPVFSPDGRWIYYAARHGRYHYNANVYAGIWQIEGYDRETGNTRVVTDGYGGSGRPRSPRTARPSPSSGATAPAPCSSCTTWPAAGSGCSSRAWTRTCRRTSPGPAPIPATTGPRTGGPSSSPSAAGSTRWTWPRARSGTSRSPPGWRRS